VTDRRFTEAEKDACRKAVKTEVRAGRLVRPSTCSKCGGGGFGKRRVIQAHHPDYSRPLHVEWLCHSCHSERAERRRRTLGRSNAREQAFLARHEPHPIARWMRANNHTLVSLAKLVGIDVATIKGLIDGSADARLRTLESVYAATGVVPLRPGPTAKPHPYEANGETWS
jgi:hypothetical protein